MEGGTTLLGAVGLGKQVPLQQLRMQTQPVVARVDCPTAQLGLQHQFLAFAIESDANFVPFLADADEGLQLFRVDQELVVKLRQQVAAQNADFLCRTGRGNMMDDQADALLDKMPIDEGVKSELPEESIR